MSELKKKIANLFNTNDTKARESLINNPITADEVLASFIDDKSFEFFLEGSPIFEKIINHKNVSNETIFSMYCFFKEKEQLLQQNLDSSIDDEKERLSSRLDTISSYLELIESSKDISKYLILRNNDKEEIRNIFDFENRDDINFLINNESCPIWVLSEVINVIGKTDNDDYIDDIGVFLKIKNHPKISGRDLVNLENAIRTTYDRALLEMNDCQEYCDSINNDLWDYVFDFDDLDEETKSIYHFNEKRVDEINSYLRELNDLIIDIQNSEPYLDFVFAEKRSFEKKLECLERDDTSKEELLNILDSYFINNLEDYDYRYIIDKIIHHPNTNDYETYINVVNYFQDTVLDYEKNFIGWDADSFWENYGNDDEYYERNIQTVEDIILNLLENEMGENLSNELSTTNNLMDYYEFFDKLHPRFIKNVFDNVNCDENIMQLIVENNFAKEAFNFSYVFNNIEKNFQMLNIFDNVIAKMELENKVYGYWDEFHFEEIHNGRSAIVHELFDNLLLREENADIFYNLKTINDIDDIKQIISLNSYDCNKKLLFNKFCNEDILQEMIKNDKLIYLHQDLLEDILKHDNCNLNLYSYIYENSFSNLNIRDFIKNEESIKNLESEFMLDVLEKREFFQDAILNTTKVNDFIEKIAIETDIKKLEQYLEEDSPFVKIGLAKNPNLSMEMVQSLSFESDKNVIKNLLDNPVLEGTIVGRELFERFFKEEEYSSVIINSKNTPEFILKKYLDDSKYTKDLLHSENSSSAILSKIKDDLVDIEDFGYLFNHKNATPLLRKEILSLDETLYKDVFKNILNKSQLSLDELDILCNLKDDKLRKIAVDRKVDTLRLTYNSDDNYRNEQLNSFLSDFIYDKNDDIRTIAARNVSDENLLAILANDDILQVSEAATKNIYCTSNIFENLAETNNPVVELFFDKENSLLYGCERIEPLRYDVIFEKLFSNDKLLENGKTVKQDSIVKAQELFKNLDNGIVEVNKEMKQALDRYFGIELENISTIDDSFVLNVLAHSKGKDYEEILRQVAINKHCDNETFEFLSKQPFEISYKLLENENCPKHIIRELIESKDFESKYVLSSNKLNLNLNELTDEVLDYLVNKNDISINRALVLSKDCPEFALEKFALGTDDFCKSVALKHKNMSGELLDVISDLVRNENDFRYMVDNPNIYPETLGKLSMKNDDFLNSKIASHPNATEDVLCYLAFSDSMNVRLNVFNNDNCPIYLMPQIAHDVLIEKNRREIIQEFPAYIETFEHQLKVVGNVNNEEYFSLLSESTVKNSLSAFKAEIAKSKSATPEILASIYSGYGKNKEENVFLNVLIASNVNTPSYILDDIVSRSETYKSTGIISSSQFEKIKEIVKSNINYENSDEKETIDLAD